MDTFAITLQEKTEYGYLKANKEKFDIELIRFKKDCRKRSLDAGLETAAKIVSNPPPEEVLDIANKYYAWLTQDAQPENIAM